MSKEKNHNTLKESIFGLPSYFPPEEIWKDISEALDQEQSKPPLQQAIDSLPKFEPPIAVWESIETVLDTQPTTKVIRPFWRQLQRVAAIGVVLMAAGIWWYTQQPTKSNATISYSTETVPAHWINQDWQEDQGGFDDVLAMVDQNPLLQNSQEYRALKVELDELDMAKMKLQSLMQQYGKDPQIIERLKNIEFERTTLIKKIAEKTISM